MTADWKSEFRNVWDRGVSAWKAGRKSPQKSPLSFAQTLGLGPIPLGSFAVAVLAGIAPSAHAEGEPGALVEHVQAHPRGEVAFSFDHSAWSGDRRKLPIGVFDSGIGGLTVLEAILNLDVFNNETLQPGADGRRDFEQERFVYFGDQANMPYGNYPAAGRVDYLRELILKDAVFLLGKRFHPQPGQPAVFAKPPVKAIVVACNTATAYGFSDLRAAVAAWGIPVIIVGVVEAGARGVLEAAPERDGTIAVLATAGTCASGAYPKAIAATLGRAGRPLPQIVQQGSIQLAASIEGDPSIKRTTAEIALHDVRALLDAQLQSGSVRPINTVVLGCTHFPLVQQVIEEAFRELGHDPAYLGQIGAARTYIDPAEWTARELFRELAKARLRVPTETEHVLSTDLFFLSVPNPVLENVRLDSNGGLDRDYKHQRATGRLNQEDTVNVPLTVTSLPGASARLVREKLPLVWQRLSASP